jgi:hypothetical protein
MNEYRYTVELTVTVSAYDEDDAEELLNDTFGQGDDCGVKIESTKFSALD